MFEQPSTDFQKRVDVPDAEPAPIKDLDEARKGLGTYADIFLQDRESHMEALKNVESSTAFMEAIQEALNSVHTDIFNLIEEMKGIYEKEGADYEFNDQDEILVKLHNKLQILFGDFNAKELASNLQEMVKKEVKL